MVHTAPRSRSRSRSRSRAQSKSATESIAFFFFFFFIFFFFFFIFYFPTSMASFMLEFDRNFANFGSTKRASASTSRLPSSDSTRPLTSTLRPWRSSALTRTTTKLSAKVGARYLRLSVAVTPMLVGRFRSACGLDGWRMAGGSGVWQRRVVCGVWRVAGGEKVERQVSHHAGTPG